MNNNFLNENFTKIIITSNPKSDQLGRGCNVTIVGSAPESSVNSVFPVGESQHQDLRRGEYSADNVFVSTPYLVSYPVLSYLLLTLIGSLCFLSSRLFCNAFFLLIGLGEVE